MLLFFSHPVIKIPPNGFFCLVLGNHWKFHPQKPVDFFGAWKILQKIRMAGCAMPTFEEPDVGSLADSNSTLPWQWQHGSALASLRGLSLGDRGGWLPLWHQKTQWFWLGILTVRESYDCGRFLRHFCVFQIDGWLLLEVSEHFLWMSVEKTRRAVKHMRLLDLGKFLNNQTAE